MAEQVSDYRYHAILLAFDDANVVDRSPHRLCPPITKR